MKVKNNTDVCYIMQYMKVKKVNPKSSHHKKIFFYFLNFMYIWDDGYSQNLLWS